jgi:hypothetical protein
LHFCFEAVFFIFRVLAACKSLICGQFFYWES